MLHGTDRSNYRDFFFKLWKKMQTQEKLKPLEQIAAALIEQHPEYHDALLNIENDQPQEFPSNSLYENPFMHLGMHMGLIEQLQLDRPTGIRAVYMKLMQGDATDEHQLQHQIMDIMGQQMWDAMHRGVDFDEMKYLEALGKLAR